MGEGSAHRGRQTEVSGPHAAEVNRPHAAEVSRPHAAEVSIPHAAEVSRPHAEEVSRPHPVEVSRALLVELSSARHVELRSSCRWSSSCRGQLVNSVSSSRLTTYDLQLWKVITPPSELRFGCSWTLWKDH